jgi:hypothetical protein
MTRGHCQVCKKPLLEQPGPVLMDRQGLRYHFVCWRDMIDVLNQKHREAIADQGAPIGEAAEKLTEPSGDGANLNSLSPP